MASETAYAVYIHRRAEAELDALADEHDVDDPKERIFDAAACRQPKTHPCVEELAGFPGYLRIDGDGIRAICVHADNEVRVLLVDKRRVVYRRLETAVRRAADAEGGVVDGE